MRPAAEVDQWRRDHSMTDFMVHEYEGAIAFPHCSGPCAQGRKHCPSPMACCQAEPEPIQPSGRMALVLAIVVVAALAAIVFGGHAL